MMNENISLDVEDSISSAPDSAPQNENPDTPPSQDNESDVYEEIDYASLVKEDMAIISEEFSQGKEIEIGDLKNPLRYGALRDLGLTPREAYLASGGRIEKTDNRSHLSPSVPRISTQSFSEIPRSQLEAARSIFTDMSDSEIRTLYRKVTQ